MGNINQPRTIRNAQYSEQIKEVTQAQLENIICEDGALIMLNDEIFVGINQVWVKIAPVTGVNSLMYQKAEDTEYNLASPFNFLTNTEYVLPNNAGSDYIVINSAYAYKNGIGTFLFELHSNYLLKISFKAHLNTNNGHAELYLEDEDGNLFDECADVITFPKGNGVEHRYSRTFFIGSRLSTTVEAKFIASHSGSIYDVVYEIQKIR